MKTGVPILTIINSGLICPGHSYIHLIAVDMDKLYTWLLHVSFVYLLNGVLIELTCQILSKTNGRCKTSWSHCYGDARSYDFPYVWVDVSLIFKLGHQGFKHLDFVGA